MSWFLLHKILLLMTSEHRAGPGVVPNSAVWAAVSGRLALESESDIGKSQQNLSGYEDHDGYDDGLVHNHGWACS